MENRIQINIEQSKPILNYYNAKGLLRNVDGESGIDNLFKQFNQLWANLARNCLLSFANYGVAKIVILRKLDNGRSPSNNRKKLSEVRRMRHGKEDVIEIEGIVNETLTNAMFKVELESGQGEVLAHVSEKSGCTTLKFYRAMK